MGTNECSQWASKSSWDSQDFGDISMVLKMAHFRKSTGPQWVNLFTACTMRDLEVLLQSMLATKDFLTSDLKWNNMLAGQMSNSLFTSFHK